MNRFYHIFSINEKFLLSFENELKRRNFYDERIFKNWPYIVDEYSNKITPCKIIFSGIENDIKHKVLYVSTHDRMFATEFLFHKKKILEKLNSYFGEEKSKFIDIKLKIID